MEPKMVNLKARMELKTITKWAPEGSNSSRMRGRWVVNQEVSELTAQPGAMWMPKMAKLNGLRAKVELKMAKLRPQNGGKTVYIRIRPARFLI